MCGRTVCSFGPKCVRKLCTRSELKLAKVNCNDVKEKSKKDTKDNLPPYCCLSDTDSHVPSYNIAPGSYCPVLISSQHDHISSLTVIQNGTNDMNDDVGYVIQPMLWGLVPWWHKGDRKEFGLKLNNTRVESLTKPMFKTLLGRRRCVVVVDGFYEWKTEDGKKQPFFFYLKENENIYDDIEKASIDIKMSEKDLLKDNESKIGNETDSETLVKNIKKEEIKGGVEERDKDTFKKEIKMDMGLQDVKVEENVEKKEKIEKIEEELMIKGTSGEVTGNQNENHRKVLTMAGLFDAWTCKMSRKVTYSFSIITVEAKSPPISSIHHRMPAVLKGDEIEKWLDIKAYTPDQVMPLLRETDHLGLYAVSSKVNNSKVNSIDCLKEIDLTELKDGGSAKKRRNDGSVSMMEAWLKKRKTLDKETDKEADKQIGK